MTVLPEAAALDDPPGRPESVQDAAAGARAAAGLLTELAAAVGTAQPAFWEGDDARALRHRGTTVSRVSADAADALLRGATRLAQHAELWHVTRARLGALRTEQEADRAAAGARVALPLDPSDLLAAPVDDVLGALAAAEDRRAAEHRRLLAVLQDDVVDTARVLRACGLVIGAVGGRGRLGRQTAHLAAVLPGWGALEVAAHGHRLAEVLRFGDVEQSEASAAGLVGLAGDPVFASALLSELGVAGLRQLFLDLDNLGLGEDSAVARVLAAALGAAGAEPGTDQRVRDVLSARYVEASADSWLEDQVARGLAIVALTGARYGRPPAPATIAAWVRQVSAREAALGPAPERLRSQTDDALDADPLQGLLGALASTGDAAAAAGLLAGAEVWTHLLGRSWQDGGNALGDVVGSLSGAPDGAARAALRAGLEALGAGLEDGHPHGWTVDRGTAEALRPELGGALAAHVETITEPLADVAARCPDVGELAALNGLGFLTIDEGATDAIVRGLQTWAGSHQPRAMATGGGSVLVAVPSAFLAVLHHGQRLAHSLRSHDMQVEAERARRRWDSTVGLLVEIMGRTVARPVEPLLGALETTLQRAVGADGRFDVGEDRGRRFTGADAAVWTAGGAGDHRDEALRQVAHTAADVFARVQSALGEPDIAVSDDRSLVQELVDDALEVDPADRLRGAPRSRRGSAATAPE